MHDYVYPSIFLAYFMFFLFVAGALFFVIRSRHDGYWGDHSEDPKHRMLADDDRIRSDSKIEGDYKCRH